MTFLQGHENGIAFQDKVAAFILKSQSEKKQSFLLSDGIIRKRFLIC